MSKLGQAMNSIRDVFEKYAGKDSDPETLTKAELSQLLLHEFGMKDTASKGGKIDEFFKMLDNDKDGVVSFQEYVAFVAALTTMM